MQNTNLTNTQTPRYATWLDPISTQPTHEPLDTLLGWTLYQPNQHTNSSIHYFVGHYTIPTNTQTPQYATWLDPIPTQPTHTLLDTLLGWTLYQPNQHTHSSIRYLVGPYTNPTNTQTPRYATWLDPIPTQPTHTLLDTLLGWTLYQPNQHTNSSIRYLVGLYTNPTNTQTPRYATWLDPISTQPTHKLLDTLLGSTLYQPNQHTNSSIRYLVGPYINPTNTQTPRYATWLDPIPTQPTHKLLDTLLDWTLYQPNQHTNSSIRYLVGPYINPTNTQTPRYATWLDPIPTQLTYKLLDTLLG